MEFDGSDSMEDSGPPCRYQKLMPGPWRKLSDRLDEGWGWRHQDSQFAQGNGEPVWEEGPKPVTIDITDVFREHLREIDATVRANQLSVSMAPRLVRNR